MSRLRPRLADESGSTLPLIIFFGFRFADGDGRFIPFSKAAVDGLTMPGAFTDMGLTLRRGEILGIFGLEGSGAEAFLRRSSASCRPWGCRSPWRREGQQCRRRSDRRR